MWSELASARYRMNIWRGMGSVGKVEGVGTSAGIHVHDCMGASGDDDMTNKTGLRGCYLSSSSQV